MSQSTIQPSSTSSNVDASGESEFEISNLRSTASHLPRGAGEVEFARVAGKTVALRAQSCNPLKLLMPRSSGGCGWLFTSTYGGGLVEGDDIRLGVIARQDTRCLISTQASTKIYRTPTGSSRQSLHVHAEDRAIVVVAPDPLVCFAGASFEQRQQFDLTATAALVMVDWLASGRWACGERWAFSSYENQTRVNIAGEPVFRDILRLDPRDGPIAGAMRMGQFDCFATVLVIGNPLAANAARLLENVNAAAAPARDDAMLFAASPCPGGGVMLRIAGPSTEMVGHWIRKQLNFLPEIIGQDPWARKY